MTTWSRWKWHKSTEKNTFLWWMTLGIMKEYWDIGLLRNFISPLFNFIKSYNMYVIICNVVVFEGYAVWYKFVTTRILSIFLWFLAYNNILTLAWSYLLTYDIQMQCWGWFFFTEGNIAVVLYESYGPTLGCAQALVVRKKCDIYFLY